MFDFKFSPDVKLTDLITSISVLCAAATLIYTWNKDRKIKTKDYIDKIRTAASFSLAKIDRCQIIFCSISDLVQPEITNIDNSIVRDRDKLACRDQMWKSLNTMRLEIIKKFNDEQIESAYAPLFVFKEEIYDRFKITMHNVRSLENDSFQKLQEIFQIVILNADEKKIQNAQLGNSLRHWCFVHKIIYEEFMDEALGEVRSFLKQTVVAPEADILSVKNEKIKKEISMKKIDWKSRWIEALSSLNEIK